MSASPFAQRAAHISAEGWRAPTSSSTAAGPTSAAYTGANGAIAGPSTYRQPAPVQAHYAYISEAGPSTAASEMSAATYTEPNGKAQATLAERSPVEPERHAPKARRTSSGGSRVPSEEPGPAVQDAEGRHRELHHQPSSLRGTAAAANGTGSNGSAQKSTQSGTGSVGRGAASAILAGPSRRKSEERPHLDLATFPPHDLLRVLATLLHQIASANDKLRPASSVGAGAKANASDAAASTTASGASSDRKRRHREQPPEMAIAPGAEGMSGAANGGGIGSSTSSVMSPSVEAAMGGFDADGNPRRRLRPTTAAMAALQAPTSTLCFHARNVPSISIEAYLMRILKYCPTTNEVFLSLLVYFDRMSRMGHRTVAAAVNASEHAITTHGEGEGASEDASRSDDATTRGSTPSTVREDADSATSSSAVTVLADGMPPDGEPHVGIRGFAIDSYNVHRLVIAGVTVASKFFSDVFYTNSRYAKVGGLPVHELNQLELQFLLLNDFSLMIPLEEMQHYADQLLYYASAPSTASSDSPQAASSASARGQARDEHGDTAMHAA